MSKKDQTFLKNLKTQHEHEKKSIDQQKHQTLLGIDYGEKYTGLSIYENGVILPLEVRDSRFQILEGLSHLCQKREISLVIWGFPLGIHNEENHICQTIKKLAEKLQKQTHIPYKLVNERYSTQLTLTPEKTKSKINGSNRKSAQARVDDLAAMRILEFYLNTL